MFVHLGEQTIVRQRHLIAVLDIAAAEAPDTRAFLSRAARSPGIEDISAGQAKSIVITTRRVYLSPISAETLRRRTRFLRDLSVP